MRKFVAYQRQTQNLNPEPKSQEDPTIRGLNNYLYNFGSSVL